MLFRSKVKQNPKVEAVAPFTQMQGLLTNDGNVQKVLLNAIDPAQERNVSIIDRFMQQGQLDSLTPGSFGIIITVIMGMVLFQQRLNRKGWLGLSMLVLSIVLIKMA